LQPTGRVLHAPVGPHRSIVQGSPSSHDLPWYEQSPVTASQVAVTHGPASGQPTCVYVQPAGAGRHSVSMHGPRIGQSATVLQVPQPSTGACVHPVPLVHESVVHGFASSQSMGVVTHSPATHAASSQMSEAPQSLGTSWQPVVGPTQVPTMHPSSLGQSTGSIEHAPVTGSHWSSVQTSPSSHAMASCAQVPPTHASAVHASPSSQGMGDATQPATGSQICASQPFDGQLTAVYVQPPRASQASSVHTLPSSHPCATCVQSPSAHESRVQSSPSSQVAGA
jgi:hypothetical protein